VPEVLYLPEAEAEEAKLPATERAAMGNAVRKLEALGAQLGPPHSSHVLQTESLRELRPKAGKSPWRGLYSPVGEAFVIAAICPEAKKDSRGFDRGVENALTRLAELEE
jgi:hypothetical protein